MVLCLPRGVNRVRIALTLSKIAFWGFKSNSRLDDSNRMLLWALLTCVSWLPFLKHVKKVFYFFHFLPIFSIDLPRHLTANLIGDMKPSWNFSKKCGFFVLCPLVGPRWGRNTATGCGKDLPTTPLGGRTSLKNQKKCLKFIQNRLASQHKNPNGPRALPKYLPQRTGYLRALGPSGPEGS